MTKAKNYFLLSAIALLSLCLPATGNAAEIVAPDHVDPAQLELVTSFRLSVLRGPSVFVYNFSSPVAANPVYLRYIQTFDCQFPPAVDLSIRRASDGRWERTRYDQSRGAWWHQGDQLASVRFDFYNNYNRPLLCDFLVYRDKENNLPEEGELIGALTYSGGFVQRQVFAIENPSMVKAIQFKIPSFCKDIDILEAGTITQEVYHEALENTPNSNKFAVNNGLGEEVSSIVVSLNGPTDQACDIPIYVFR